jgi:alanine dehydrogenase
MLYIRKNSFFLINMIKIGIIREGKTPQDNRVPFTPIQCKEIMQQYPSVVIVVQPSAIRCYKDEEYEANGIVLQENVSDCDILFGVKEVLIDELISNKKYFFFSHTKKKQSHNKKLMQALIAKEITMIDYECLTHADGHRIVGFGFWAGVVGAHNGLLTYGKKNNSFTLQPAYTFKNLAAVKDSYDLLKLPNIKIAVTGSGRVASGVLDILHYLDISEVNQYDYLNKTFDYPVFIHLQGAQLYARKDDSSYNREDFHAHPENYSCLFLEYSYVTDILMNGIYWDTKIDPLFQLKDIQNPLYKMNVISDITCDEDGSVPCNVGSSTIAEPVYGFDKITLAKTLPFQNNKEVIDIMAVDNLPNELPRDASKYFGSYLVTYIIPALVDEKLNDILHRATICKNGKLNEPFEYLHDYTFL